ncbi:pyruvate dehydrogenase (acetyl-transferring) E1 component subunit alpha [Sansalvadorimonas verongulae]|uniref:pyruvate dehydrogenase (acetyl-transferring) E1 component subunit alpha n=1 Tax=Sansalvadorimonas verongulae TaxID=2172824 RepID=UPI0012BCA1FF|nr:pyruvate dehydrogenase (acetyl-transferring) E1 component subunit alpha [Sansalvadorimonas verongulae]MTI13574.1 pyruvate dehydrogenase (acetyl-transferring) E1 component subunit alpha [Sansalvadorimonas verongulae]
MPTTLDGGGLFRVHSSDVPFVRYLNTDGQPVQKLPPWAENGQQLVAYYKAMVKAREADRKAIAMQRTGQMGTYPSCLGQEAPGVVYGSLMKKDDVLAPYYRDMPGQLLRGVELSDVYLYWGGDERGSAGEGYGQDMPNCVPIATQACHAVGIASAFRIRDERRVVVTTCGDGATSKGDFLEALNLAGAWKVPVVFLIVNNQWAISIPRSAQCGADTLAQKGAGAGVPCVQVDGNDVIALHEVIGSAIERARHGKGAVVIEAITYRLCDHTTADDATRYRDNEDVRKAWEEEPVKRLQTYLYNHGLWSPEQEKMLQEQVAEEVQKAVETYQLTPPQSINDLFAYQYAETPVSLRQQLEEMQEGLNHE